MPLFFRVHLFFNIPHFILLFSDKFSSFVSFRLSTALHSSSSISFIFLKLNIGLLDMHLSLHDFESSQCLLYLHSTCQSHNLSICRCFSLTFSRVLLLANYRNNISQRLASSHFPPHIMNYFKKKKLSAEITTFRCSPSLSLMGVIKLRLALVFLPWLHRMLYMQFLVTFSSISGFTFVGYLYKVELFTIALILWIFSVTLLMYGRIVSILSSKFVYSCGCYPYYYAGGIF